jgi:hypothetical protein
VLFDCARPYPTPYGTQTRMEPRLLDLATRAVSEPAGAAAAIDAWASATLGSVTFPAIGTAGIAYVGSAYHGGGTGALDWRTGTAVSDPGSPNQIVDLDVAGLVTTLCAPIVRQPYDIKDDPDQPLYDPLQYDAPYALQNGPESSMTLQRCGSRSRVVLAGVRKGSTQAANAQLAAGFVSWTGIGFGNVPLYAYLPSCAAKLRWSVRYGVVTAHLPNALVVSDHDTSDAPWRVRDIALGGACSRLARADRLTVSSLGRRVVAIPRGGTIADVPTGATVDLSDRAGSAPRLRARTRARIAVRTGVPASSVRWRLGAGTWRAASGRGTAWTLRFPASHGTHRLRVSVRFATGGGGQFDARLQRVKG